jgi:hypothetical protein
MSEDKKPFTVSDRRHFTSEGEVRETGAEEPTSPPPADAPRAEVSPAEARAAEPSEADADHGQGEDQDGGPRFPRDFLGLLVSLGAQASMLLMGGAEDERPDLEGAHALIDLLASLKEKTEGHRTPQEDKLLDGLLYELRMAYVQATRGPSR